jgi:urea transport system substrate-binding protein
MAVHGTIPTPLSQRSALTAGSVVAVAGLLLTGCGSKASETDSATAESRVDTSGATIKVGALNSLSGTMAICEASVRNAIDLAVEQINTSGGVLGKQINLVGGDGTSEPTVFTPARPPTNRASRR